VRLSCLPLCCSSCLTCHCLLMHHYCHQLTPFCPSDFIPAHIKDKYDDIGMSRLPACLKILARLTQSSLYETVWEQRTKLLHETEYCTALIFLSCYDSFCLYTSMKLRGEARIHVLVKATAHMLAAGTNIAAMYAHSLTRPAYVKPFDCLPSV
jgi:hypothetical protein